MDRRPGIDLIRVDRGRRGPGLGSLVVIVCAAVLVAIVKPWGGATGGPGSTGGGSGPIGTGTGTGVGVAASPRPGAASGPASEGSAADDSPSPTSSGLIATSAEDALCLSPLGWRIMTDTPWDGREIRTWTATSAVVATGPTDPQIVFVPTVAVDVNDLGFCAPVAGADLPPSVIRTRVWLLHPAGASTLVTVRDVTPVGVAIGLARLYALRPTTGGVSSWPAGRYVFELDGTDADGTSYRRWLGADVIRFIEPPAQPSVVQPGPSASPS